MTKQTVLRGHGVERAGASLWHLAVGCWGLCVTLLVLVALPVASLPFYEVESARIARAALLALPAWVGLGSILLLVMATRRGAKEGSNEKVLVRLAQSGAAFASSTAFWAFGIAPEARIVALVACLGVAYWSARQVCSRTIMNLGGAIAVAVALAAGLGYGAFVIGVRW